MPNTTCSADGCESTSKRARGLCSKHYQRAVKAERMLTSPCPVDGCKLPRNGRSDYCLTHAARLKKHGDVNVTMKGKAHKVVYTTDGMRVCKACGVPKPVSEFHRDSGGTDGYRAQCKPCRNGYMAGYYSDNQDARMAYERDRRLNRPGHMRALDMARYERNKDKRILLASDGVRRRRARLAGVKTDPDLTTGKLREIHGDLCCYCGVLMDFVRGKRGEGIARNRATLEHKMPVSRGGEHTFENTALACHLCNVSKNSKTIQEWEAWKAGFDHGREETVAAGADC